MPRSISKKLLLAFERYVQVEAVSGIILMLAAAAALIWANSPAAHSYHDLWHARVGTTLGGYDLSQSLHFLINDGLMTVFFLVVGAEIRREMHDGALANLQLAALPLAAALGGVAVPALIYVAINTDPELQAGWAVPTATDIAFAVGVLALLGKSVPGALRVFLLALAIIDDIAAVIIIAIFYSGGLDYSGLIFASVAVLAILGLQRIGVTNPLAYVLPGALLWFGLLRLGIHPTLAGVALGLLTPVRSVERVEQRLHPWVAYGIMPLFALANAGVSLEGVDLASIEGKQVMLGTALALVLGKPIGIFVGSWIAVLAGWCRLPPGVNWQGVALIGCLGGIGFTMSIFIATLAFSDEQLLAAAKCGVLLASAVAGVVGLTLGWLQRR
jgi:NhaA family Na+:H+ antiporter